MADGKIVACAPILYRSLAGMTLKYAEGLCAERGWEMTLIERDDASA